MASLLVGMTRNDVMINIRGGATCNNNKQFKHVPLAKSLFKFCNDTAPQSRNVLNELLTKVDGTQSSKAEASMGPNSYSSGPILYMFKLSSSQVSGR